MDPKYKLRAFEKCVHCSEVYFFFLEVEIGGIPSDSYLVLPARSRQEAFILLGVFREHSKEPMMEREYGTWGQEIVRSLLPECNPAQSVLEQLKVDHVANRSMAASLLETIGLLKLMARGNPDQPLS